MKGIGEYVKERVALEKELAQVKRDYEKRIADIKKKISVCLQGEECYVEGIDFERIEHAKKIVYLSGNIWADTQDCTVIAEEAIKDISMGCNHLKREYYGNKRYEGYYQYCCCRYGFGPSHGSIVDRIELCDEYRKRDLTVEEINDAIYYIKLYDKVMEIEKKAKESVK